MSETTGIAFVAWRVSSAHCCLALSICRRLLIHAFIWAVVRALTKLGIAIAANSPIMATTIMISTSVKPAFLFFLLCILLIFLFVGPNIEFERAARTTQKAGFIFTTSLFANCLLQPLAGLEQTGYHFTCDKSPGLSVLFWTNAVKKRAADFVWSVEGSTDANASEPVARLAAHSNGGLQASSGEASDSSA